MYGQLTSMLMRCLLGSPPGFFGPIVDVSWAHNYYTSNCVYMAVVLYVAGYNYSYYYNKIDLL